jgi:hypothetical protein
MGPRAGLDVLEEQQKTNKIPVGILTLFDETLLQLSLNRAEGE